LPRQTGQKRESRKDATAVADVKMVLGKNARKKAGSVGDRRHAGVPVRRKREKRGTKTGRAASWPFTNLPIKGPREREGEVLPEKSAAMEGGNPSMELPALQAKNLEAKKKRARGTPLGTVEERGSCLRKKIQKGGKKSGPDGARSSTNSSQKGGG